jgi:hypothetical protein
VSAEAATFVRSWAVGERIATLTLPHVRPGKSRAAAIEWSPSRPAKLSPSEWQQYREGRNAALAELARELGGTVALVEA